MSKHTLEERRALAKKAGGCALDEGTQGQPMSDEPSDFQKAAVEWWKQHPPRWTQHPGSHQPTFLDTLAGLTAQTRTLQRQWFKDQTLHIDGYVFEDCRFDRCSLVTEMATFTFRRCFMSSDCRLYFRGSALKTVRLMMHVLRLQQRIAVRADELGLYATLGHDGTFTVE